MKQHYFCQRWNPFPNQVASLKKKFPDFKVFSLTWYRIPWPWQKSVFPWLFRYRGNPVQGLSLRRFDKGIALETSAIASIDLVKLVDKTKRFCQSCTEAAPNFLYNYPPSSKFADWYNVRRIRSHVPPKPCLHLWSPLQLQMVHHQYETFCSKKNIFKKDCITFWFSDIYFYTEKKKVKKLRA